MLQSRAVQMKDYHTIIFKYLVLVAILCSLVCILSLSFRLWNGIDYVCYLVNMGVARVWS